MQLPSLPLDPYTIVFTVGLLYTIMPLTVWTVLRGRHNGVTTTLWCLGALLSGVNYLLFGLRMSLPLLVSLHLANALGYAAYTLRWAALRRERGAAVPVWPLVAIVLVCSVAYAMLADQGARPRVTFAVLTIALGSAALAWEARQLARLTGSRSALMVAAVYALLAATSLLRMAIVLADSNDPLPFDFTADVYLLLFVGVLSALWGNIGYLGFAIEQAERRVSARTAELAAAHARREEAERQTAETRMLSDERQELLRVISHEARQPLHNAQAVLQGVDGALHAGLAGSEAAGARIARARSVLQQITASLDNTLAVSTMLVEDRPPALRDADIDMLLELCIGDLPPQQRSRVDVVRQTAVRTAAMDVGLMRLALRNLLNNALVYTQPGSRVTLRVADSDEPLALLIVVADGGPGIPPDLLPRVFDRGSRGRLDLHGQGLGLYIVRRAMQRQGGTVDVRSGPEGSVFTLTVPQGLEPC